VPDLGGEQRLRARGRRAKNLGRGPYASYSG
jgi:hypothetical protein